MKTLIAVAVLAASVLSFGAQASSRATLLEAAAAYKADKGNFLNQGYFMGMVTMAAEAGNNCVPDGMKLGSLYDKVASIILYDQKVNAVKKPSDMVLLAIDTAFPCVES